MTIDYDKLLNLDIPEVEQIYTEKDVILYALGIGVGADPLNERELDFVYEKNLRPLPTLPVILAYPGFWTRDLETGIDWVRLVHGEQELIIHESLAPAGHVVGKTRVVDVVDKGAGKGALVYAEKSLCDKASGTLLATVRQTLFCRRDGGFGGPQQPRRPQRPAQPLPERAPDLICDLPSLPQSALLYRLSGDYNPLHADPAVAAAAGFPQPILHGLATYGIAGHAILKTVCDYDANRIAAMSARFSAPVYPGETFRTEIWQDGPVVQFQTKSLTRDIVALSNGRVDLRL